MSNEEAFVINEDTTDAVEIQPVPAGEYKVQVVRAEGKEGVGQKSGNAWRGIQMTLDIPDEIAADYINHMVFLPNEDQDEKQRNRALGNLKLMKQAFGIPEGQPFTPSDLVGKEAWAYITQEETEDYGTQNRVRKFVTGPQESGDEYGL